MKTKVFVSWGGELSCKIAEAISRWMQMVIQSVDPFYSAKSIRSGSYYPAELIKNLESTSIGVICLTRECLDNNWIHFESGSIFKGIEDARIHTLLFDIESSDVKPPLSFFQHKKFDKIHFKEFMEEINEATGDLKLSGDVFNSAFEKSWDDLYSEIQSILNSHDGSGEIPSRSTEDMVKEILDIVRSTQRSNSLFSGIATEYRNFVYNSFALLESMEQNMPEDISSDFKEAFMTLKNDCTILKNRQNSLLLEEVLSPVNLKAIFGPAEGVIGNLLNSHKEQSPGDND